MKREWISIGQELGVTRGRWHKKKFKGVAYTRDLTQDML
jgi:hypothetical protein